MAHRAEHNTRNKRLATCYKPEKERGDMRVGTSNFVTMRSNGIPDLQLLVGFLAGFMVTDSGPDNGDR